MQVYRRITVLAKSIFKNNLTCQNTPDQHRQVDFVKCSIETINMKFSLISIKGRELAGNIESLLKHFLNTFDMNLLVSK